MFRYVALIWESINHRHMTIVESLSERFQYSPSAWREAVSDPGLRVFCTDVQHGVMEPQLLAGYAGVVLGAVYKSNASAHDDAPARKLSFDESTTQAIRASHGQWLIRNAWGNYVAIWCDPRTGMTCVLKDPTGNLPAFSTTYEGITLVFSSIPDCLDLGVRTFTVNRRAIALRVYGGDMTHELEPLNEVTQIRRGECVDFNPRAQPSIASRRFYWNPFRLERMHEWMEDDETAAVALRNTLRSCTRTLAKEHESALVRLSGGLDSSIILGCLTDMLNPPRLLSYTQYTTDAGTDPRPWARAALEYRPCEHSELALAAATIDLKAILRIAPSVEPFSTLMYLIVGAHEQELAAARKATALFSGDGGDSAFGSFCVGEVIHAYLRRHGPGPAVLRLAAQSAQVLQQTTWTALASGLKTWVTRRPLHTLETQNEEAVRLVHPEVVRLGQAHGTRHPWFRGVHPVPWETLSKLGMLLGTPDLYAGAGNPAATSPQLIAPIYAQPMVELVLRIPADVLFADGRSRGLARRAFAGLVAPKILERTWKDRPGTFHEELIHHNLDWLRDVLLNGVLVREQLLDRAAVENALSRKMVKSNIYPAEILRHLDTEMWMSHWPSSRAALTQ